MIRLTLPFPPSINHYWRHCTVKGRVRVYISPEGKQYQADACYHAILGSAGKGYAGRLSVKIWLYPPDRRARDIDNSVKVLIDSLQAANVFKNDSQIDELYISRAGVQKGGSAVVEVSEI